MMLFLTLSSLANYALAQEDGTTDRTIYIVIIILALSLSGRAISAWLANRNRQQVGLPPIRGPLGGTICPNCAKPYAFHLWSIKLVLARIDRCPHCGKWKIVKRYPQDVLEASAEAMTAAQEGATAVSLHPTLSHDDQLRKNLDDSRFED